MPKYASAWEDVENPVDAYGRLQQNRLTLKDLARADTIKERQLAGMEAAAQRDLAVHRHMESLGDIQSLEDFNARALPGLMRIDPAVAAQTKDVFQKLFAKEKPAPVGQLYRNKEGRMVTGEEIVGQEPWQAPPAPGSAEAFATAPETELPSMVERRRQFTESGRSPDGEVLVQVEENGRPVWRPRSAAAGKPAFRAPEAGERGLTPKQRGDVNRQRDVDLLALKEQYDRRRLGGFDAQGNAIPPMTDQEYHARRMAIQKTARETLGTVTPAPPQAPQPPAPPGGGVDVRAPNGRTYHFADPAKAADFKRAAGLP